MDLVSVRTEVAQVQASAGKCGASRFHVCIHLTGHTSLCTSIFGRLRPRPSDRRPLVRVCRRQVPPAALHYDGPHSEVLNFLLHVLFVQLSSVPESPVSSPRPTGM